MTSDDPDLGNGPRTDGAGLLCARSGLIWRTIPSKLPKPEARIRKNVSDGCTDGDGAPEGGPEVRRNIASIPGQEGVDSPRPQHDFSRTSPTLLGRVALFPFEQEAWDAFVKRYAPKIVQWCRARRLQEADILDVSQAVLTKLLVRMRNFVYDPSQSFRGLLKKVVNAAIADAQGARGPAGARGGSENIELLASVQAREELASRLEDEYDLEIFEAASRLVRARVRPRTWEAYQLTTVGQLSGAQAAHRLGMRVVTVYKAKSSVIRMIREEMRRMEGSPTHLDPD
jgi:RNA polymerase sigma-70 factor, ECF subfamily